MQQARASPTPRRRRRHGSSSSSRRPHRIGRSPPPKIGRRIRSSFRAHERCDWPCRREVIHALEKRGVAHDDLLEEDAEDDALKRRLKLHACASRGQMEAAEASATEATRREYEKTLETPAGEWF